MKQLLTCLAYVYALVLVPNSVAAQTMSADNITIKAAWNNNWETAIRYSSKSDSGIYQWNVTREQIKDSIPDISNFAPSQA